MDIEYVPWAEKVINNGTKVYAIQRLRGSTRILEGTVRSIIAEVIDISTDAGVQNALFLRNYKLDQWNLSRSSGDFYPNEVFTDKSKAETAAKFYVVTATDKEWSTAIGDRNDESIDICDLTRCCANVSHARDLLIDCKNMGGLCELDREILFRNLEGHDVGPTLKVILEQMRK